MSEVERDMDGKKIRLRTLPKTYSYCELEINDNKGLWLYGPHGHWMPVDEAKNIIKQMTNLLESVGEHKMIEIIKNDSEKRDAEQRLEHAKDRFGPSRRGSYGKQNGIIYLIYDSKTELHKIGATKNEKRRLRELKKRYGDHIQMIHYWESSDCYNEESALHYEFVTHWQYGEWFSFSNDFIRSLMKFSLREIIGIRNN